MTKTLDLSALKNKAQQSTSAAARSISLGATVKTKTTVPEAPKPTPTAAPEVAAASIVAETKVVENAEPQNVKCSCPAPETSSVTPNPSQTPENISTPSIQKNTIANTTTAPVEEKIVVPEVTVEAPEEESKKAMISLGSIKSSHTAKKAEEQKVAAAKKQETTEEGKTEEKIVEKEITVVAPAMKIASVEKVERKSEAKIEDTSKISESAEKESDNSDLDILNTKVPEKTVDTKLVAEESKKLQDQIEKDLKENETKEKNEKKDIQIDDDIFDNYKPKYGKKEDVANGATGEKKIHFKKHLSRKKRNIIIAGLILFMLGVSAGGYLFFSGSSVEDEPIHATAIEDNIAQTKENVENIIDNEATPEDEETENTGEASIGDENANTDNTFEQGEKGEESENEENIETQDENLDDENGELAQAENSGESKVKSYLLDNYYK